MLIIDREDGQSSHTMWVIKPIAPARFEHDTPTIVIPENDLAPEPASTIRSAFVDQSGFEPVTPFPFTQPISRKPILCRICECQIPQWYFEKHSETCVETHWFEAEIVECNESISELRNTIRELCIAVDRPSPIVIPEYRGMQIFSPSSSPIVSSPLQLFRANKMQRLGIKKMQRRLLDQIDEILQVALEISMPSPKEEEGSEPIERQRLLSPSSERKITQIRQWSKPNTEDAALTQLIQDAQRIMRQKVDNVFGMQNTIRYSEKIWLEWQERVEGALATVDESSSESESSSEEEGNEEAIVRDVNDQSSTVLGDDVTAPQSSEPTPAASQALISPPAVRPSAMSVRQQLQATRSSTPSSVSSPLARAEPIIAPPSPEEVVPPMFLDDAHAPSIIRTKKSASNLTLLEPKLVITPPASRLRVMELQRPFHERVLQNVHIADILPLII